jgi:hypothetical protein
MRAMFGDQSQVGLGADCRQHRGAASRKPEGADAGRIDAVVPGPGAQQEVGRESQIAAAVRQPVRRRQSGLVHVVVTGVHRRGDHVAGSRQRHREVGVAAGSAAVAVRDESWNPTGRPAFSALARAMPALPATSSNRTASVRSSHFISFSKENCVGRLPLD